MVTQATTFISSAFYSFKPTHLPPQVLRSRSTFPTPSRSVLEFLDLEGKRKKKVFPLSSLHTKSPQPVFICPELYLLQLFIWKCNQSPSDSTGPLSTAALPSAARSLKQSNPMCEKGKYKRNLKN